MQKTLMLFIGLIGFNIGLKADPIPKPDQSIPKIKGKTWQGETSQGETMTCQFLDDGVLDYKTTINGHTTHSRIATWKQDGKKVTWETNNHYADFTGTVSKSEMNISAKNIKGLEWTITLKPVKE